MNVAAIIPARYQSSRFPGKPLVPLLGKPMIIHVAEIVAAAVGKKDTYVATDSEIIAGTVEKGGYQVIMTGEDALTGTDRVWQASKKIDADIFLNVQGDEPLLDPDDIRLIVSEKKKRMNCVINGIHKIEGQEDPKSNNIPKVVVNEQNYLVYMSRSLIPGAKSDRCRPANYFKQVSMYAFTREQLDKFGNFGRKSYLEECEDIEILRFLDLAIPVYMVETDGFSLAVDVPEDVAVVEDAMKRKNRT